MLEISKAEFERMQQELELLRESSLYRRLLEFEDNISNGRKFGRKDLGF